MTRYKNVTSGPSQFHIVGGLSGLKKQWLTRINTIAAKDQHGGKNEYYKIQMREEILTYYEIHVFV